MTTPEITRPDALPRPDTLPHPRTAPDAHQRARRRVRPPEEYWDVFSASWVRAGAEISRDAAGAG
jgi:hypothetical protein